LAGTRPADSVGRVPAREREGKEGRREGKERKGEGERGEGGGKGGERGGKEEGRREGREGKEREGKGRDVNCLQIYIEHKIEVIMRILSIKLNAFCIYSV
jgi:hypothetical protein